MTLINESTHHKSTQEYLKWHQQYMMPTYSPSIIPHTANGDIVYDIDGKNILIWPVELQC
jgi:hypothetical protein